MKGLRPHTLRTLSILLLGFVLAACSFNIDPSLLTPGADTGQPAPTAIAQSPTDARPTATDAPVSPPATTPTPSNPIEVAAVTFQVSVPADTPADAPIQVSLLDEITGLALNPTQLTMTRENDTTHTITIRVTNGSLIKYRYSRSDDLFVQEHLTNGSPVRYRMLKVDGPMYVQDVVARWNDTGYQGGVGRIQGALTDAVTKQPLSGIFIAAGGAQTISAADGSYILDGLPAGTHNLTAFSPTGDYRTYQQGAVVAERANTPASFDMLPAEHITVTLNVTVPEGTIPGVPMRVAGNLSQLGNEFASLQGGFSTIANQMPVLDYVGENRYHLELSLPSGTFIRYKYTLGDGFWNAEHAVDGNFHLREFVVPNESITINDEIITFGSNESAPVWFDVTVPAYTRAEETVYIQFHPFAWTEPLPMWRLEPNRWVYQLQSPLDVLGEISYRYCRNAQCNFADDIITQGDLALGRTMTKSDEMLTIKDTVDAWVWWDADQPVPARPDITPSPRETGFTAGVELFAEYLPGWAGFHAQTVGQTKALGSNMLVTAPTWSIRQTNPPIFSLVPGEDITPEKLLRELEQTQGEGLQTAVFPTFTFDFDSTLWWAEADRDYLWWTTWFEQYDHFAQHHALLAKKANANMLILGGEWLSPALPNGFLEDGFSSGVPADAEMLWRDIIADIRVNYDGTLAWALPYPEGVYNPPAFLDAVDVVYLLWDEPLAEQSGASIPDLRQAAIRELDGIVFPFVFELDKPIILSVAYPSIANGYTTCPGEQDGECLPVGLLAQPAAELPDIDRDLQAQTDAYQAVLEAVNARDWVSGFVSRGFYPPVPLRDKSYSVHGKPAAQMLGYWFDGWIGLP